MRLRLIAPIALLVVLLAGTITAAVVVHRNDNSRAREEQKALAAETNAALGSITNGTIGRLSGLAGAFGVAGSVDAGDFAVLARPLLADSALYSVSYAKRIPDEQRGAYERAHRVRIRETRPGGKLVRAVPQSFYAVIEHSIVRDPTPSSVGVNAAADIDRRAAMLSAAMVNAPRATPPVIFKRTGRQGLIVYTPVFDGPPPRSPGDRATAVRGWTIAAYRASWLASAVRRQLPRGSDIQLSEGRTVIGAPARHLRHPMEQPVVIGGQYWTLTVGRPPSGARGSVLNVLIFGGALMALLALLLRSYIRRERYARRAVEEAEDRFRTAFDHAPIGMAIVTLDGRFASVNQALCDITGYSREQLEATSFHAITHPDDVGGDKEAIRAMIVGEEDEYATEKRYFHADGQVIPIALNVSVVTDAEGEPLHFLSQMQDITERKRFEGQLQHLAHHDPLTGLANRRRFEEELEREFATAERYGTTGAVVALDVDHFKYINDTLGHAAGDELITRVAELLKGRLRKTDTLARIGGDEFAAILPNIDAQRALSVCEQLLDVLRSHAGRGESEHERRITASIGVSIFGGEEELTAEEALVEADIAMYEAKEAGRDRVALYDTAARGQRMQARLTWAERIHRALEEDGFVLHAQPIIGLNGDDRPRHELLLRMLGEDGDLIPPGAFLSVAERFDLVQDIDRWVISHSLELLAGIQRGQPDAIIEINLSARSISDNDLPEYVAAEAKRFGAELSGLCIEVTETAAIVNVERAKQLASRLRELGCSFALDDFGSGFASFYYLKHLEFDYLKIDGEFITDLPSNHANQLVVEAVVAIAQGLGKRTVAEFVEDQRTLDLLREYGVDYAQGFFIGRPAPLDARIPTS